jgi:hypothetical protein
MTMCFPPRDLAQNELHGPFPSWLGNMTLLRFLNLRENQITSNLPLSFGDNIAIEVMYEVSVLS